VILVARKAAQHPSTWSRARMDDRTTSMTVRTPGPGGNAKLRVDTKIRVSTSQIRGP
jgi:hypothetical protein